MLILSTILLLLSNAVNVKRDSAILYSRVVIIILTYTLLLAYLSISLSFSQDNISLYSGLFKFNNYSWLFHVFILILCIVIMSISAFPVVNRKINVKNNESNPNLQYNNNSEGKISEYSEKEAIKHLNWEPRKKIENKDNHIVMESEKIIEYPLIILFCIIGSMLLISSSDLISMFLSIELQSYALYLICSIYRNSENSVSAGLTYFLLGGLSSCIILLGQSFLYINTGTTNIENIFIIISIYDTPNENLLELGYNISNIQYSFIILSIGLLFKVSSAPFHFWSPDVYDAIPTIVTTFVAIIAKISIFIFLLDIVHYTSSNNQLNWINNLMLSSILSLIIGSILGLTQYRIKRLYAYSTISHIGFLLLALCINNIESTQAFIFYLIQYSLSNLNAFIILIAIGYTLYNYTWNDKTASYRNLKDINNSPVQVISQLKGYFKINPFIAISLAITLFSFIGIPPLVGFFAKQKILVSALDNGYIFISLIAIITSVISAVYYLVVIKSMFFDYKAYTPYNNFSNFLYIIELPPMISLSISITTLIILVFIFLNYIIDDIIYVVV